MAVCLKNKRGENIIPWNEFEIRKENQNSKDKCNEPEWWEEDGNMRNRVWEYASLVYLLVHG